MKLALLNTLLHAIHLAVIGFSVLGWIWESTRPLHLALAGGIAVSWFVVGPLAGKPGMCVVTELQHRLWRSRGHHDSPNYMSFLAQRLTGKEPNTRRIELITQATFYTTTALSLALYFMS